MDTLLIAFLSGIGFIAAYNTYGRWLARKIFNLRPEAEVPSRTLNDGVDYVPTTRPVLFGHHFVSIAGTGPIVGPAIAVFWGWLPALLWVLFGSIFIGAVHDFGALVVSVRSRGQSIGDVAGRMISPRTRLLFLLILFFTIMVVIGVFGLVIANIFALYPQTVVPSWLAMPVAAVIGLLIHRRGGKLLLPSLAALGILYAGVYFGAYHAPIDLSELLQIKLYNPGAGFAAGMKSAVVVWTLILLVYCFLASTLPVWLLLQPRDYINSHQLVVAMILLALGLVVAHPAMVAPAINANAPLDAPMMFPFLFITIACGAISGFHSMVSSGTSSKQLQRETDAQMVGYGSMLAEGMLAVAVILACCAAVGLGIERDGVRLAGVAAWQGIYSGSWSGMRLGQQLGAFIEGSANAMRAIGIPLTMGMGIAAVMVASFATTTLDTATRLQRYVVEEIGGALRLAPLKNKYIATLIAVATGGALALMPGPQGPGSGGLILWPLFGCLNQLLGGLAFLVIAFYLLRHSKPLWFLIAPMILMLVLPAWAMAINMRQWFSQANWLLFSIGAAVQALQAWMVIEAAIAWKAARGVPPAPLQTQPPRAEPAESVMAAR